MPRHRRERSYICFVEAIWRKAHVSMPRNRRERSYSCFVEEIWRKAHVSMPRHRRERTHIRFVEDTLDIFGYIGKMKSATILIIPKQIS